MIDVLKEQAKRLHKERIEAAMEVLSLLLQRNIKDRMEAVKALNEVYKRHALQPLRGKAWPPDIWDKEMATIYVVAKYALGMHEEYPELFHHVFSVEETLEEAAETILNKEPHEAAKIVGFLLGGSIEDNTIARMLRVIATGVILGFRHPEDLEALLRRILLVFPEQERTVRKYARYYVALLVAEAIAVGKVRDRITKEALKQALAARIGVDRVIPDDDYIAYIAKTVFGVPEKKLRRALSLRNNVRKGSAAGS